ncbi:MAG: hypothetical protein COB53_06195 [Elusimicrobia bacterium]|nr:MAG: hypothetical protein COB53_06195 [Elusimicrobiota bacterium]
MYIVPDTGVFVEAGFRLTGSNVRVLFEALEKMKLQLVVPEVVFDETTNKYREELEDKIKTAEGRLAKANEAVARLARLADETLTLPEVKVDPEESSESYKKWLREKLDGAKTHWLPYPKIGHEEVVRRALDRKKPFDKKGHNGYRDAVIWESVLEFLEAHEGEEVIFVSGNHGDFAADDNKALHPDLVADLEARGLSPEELKFYTNFTEFRRTEIEPTIKEAINAKRAATVEVGLSSGTYMGFNLSDWLDEAVTEVLRESLDVGDLGFADDGPEMDAAHNVEMVRKPQVLVLNDHEVLVNVELKADLEIDVYINKSDYYARADEEEEASGLRIVEEVNDHVMLGILMVPAKIELEFTLDDKEGKVTSTELIRVDRIDTTPEEKF